MSAEEKTTHRGVDWRRDGAGEVSFFDPNRDDWVLWAPGVDAPPLPPHWSLFGVPTRVARPGWTSWRRLVPLGLVVLAVVVAIVQVGQPSGNPVTKEAKASASLLGRCLPQDGTTGGRPEYSATTVACTSAKAAVEVVKVIPTTPGSPLCPTGTVGVELALPGVHVAYPHVECVSPVRSGS